MMTNINMEPDGRVKNLGRGCSPLSPRPAYATAEEARTRGCLRRWVEFVNETAGTRMWLIDADIRATYSKVIHVIVKDRLFENDERFPGEVMELHNLMKEPMETFGGNSITLYKNTLYVPVNIVFREELVPFIPARITSNRQRSARPLYLLDTDCKSEISASRTDIFDDQRE